MESANQEVYKNNGYYNNNLNNNLINRNTNNMDYYNSFNAANQQTSKVYDNSFIHKSGLSNNLNKITSNGVSSTIPMSQSVYYGNNQYQNESSRPSRFDPYSVQSIKNGYSKSVNPSIRRYTNSVQYKNPSIRSRSRQNNMKDYMERKLTNLSIFRRNKESVKNYRDTNKDRMMKSSLVQTSYMSNIDNRKYGKFYRADYKKENISENTGVLEDMYFNITVNNSETHSVHYPSNTQLIYLIRNEPKVDFQDFEILDDTGKSIKEYMRKKIGKIFMKTQGRSPESAINLNILSPGNLYNVKNAYSRGTNLIGGLDFSIPNALTIYVFDTRNFKLKKGIYSKELVQIFTYIDHFSAYCNAEDHLYISGGTVNRAEMYSKITPSSGATEQLISINLMNVPGNIFPKVRAPLKQRRSWHSMIYVPDHSIYIVGGLQSHSVEVHDITKNTTTIDSKMCRSRCEAALAIVGGKYLFACFGFNRETGRFNDDVEKMDLYTYPHRWELIKPILPSQFLPSFFAISLLGENRLLLLGGKESVVEYPSYVLNIGESVSLESFQATPSQENDICIFKEKFLMPYDEENAAVVVMKQENNDISMGVQIVNLQSGSVQRVDFS